MKRTFVCDYCGSPLPEPDFIHWTFHEVPTSWGMFKEAIGMYCSSKCQVLAQQKEKSKKWDGLKKYL